MKTLKYSLLIAFALVAFASCEKDDFSGENNDQAQAPTESSLKMTKSEAASVPSNQSEFTINYAGIYDEMLYLGLVYQGGNEPHQFEVNWDGKVEKEDDKDIVVLNVSHLTTTDLGTETLVDSLAASLNDLGFSDEALESKSLWFKIINTTNEDNSLLLPNSSGNYVSTEENSTDEPEDVDHTYKMNANVVEVSCSSEGVWGNLWLKDESDYYYFVKEVDNSIDYSPVKDDLLNLEYEYTYMDSANVCDEVKSLGAAAIVIKKLEKNN